MNGDGYVSFKARGKRVAMAAPGERDTATGVMHLGTSIMTSVGELSMSRRARTLVMTGGSSGIGRRALEQLFDEHAD